ncbi:MAG: ABC transporter ATP-binding protein [Thermomicrobiales bacterium]
MIELRDIRKSYPTRNDHLDILRGVNLTIRPREAIAVMGPSGCGKSTILNILGLLEPPSSGTYRFDGQNVLELDAAAQAAFRNSRIGFVFQEHHLLPQCNVMENVLIPTFVGEKGRDAEARARALLDRVGLANRLDHLPGELSGGERQRVALARALINHPALIIADEPTGNLDPESAEGVATLLVEVQAETSAALVLVTHSRDLAESFPHRLHLEQGVLVAETQP